MTKKTRTILFSICLILFILIAPIVIFYSQGYRFDFESKEIVQTGGLYLKILPKSAQIYLNGKLKKETSILTNSALIENLLPKTYLIEVKKERYKPWQKNLEIKEKQVTEVKNIVLFPETSKFEILMKNVSNFWVSPDGKKIVTYELENFNQSPTFPPSLTLESGWALKLYGLEKNIKSHLINEADIYSRGADLFNLEFSKDSKEVYLNLGMKEQEKNFVLEIDKSPPILTEKKVSPIPQNIITSQNINNEVYYLDNSGYVFQTDISDIPLQQETGLKITEKPFPVQRETEYKLRIFPDYIFLQESEVLYLFNPNLKSFEKFCDNVSDLKISPDLKKLAFFSKSEIRILFLKEILEQPIKKAGEEILLTRLSKKINDVFWLNSDYLIFSSGEKIKITEIDNRDKINIVDLTEFTKPKIFWNQTDKKLYILSESNLYISERLIK